MKKEQEKEVKKRFPKWKFPERKFSKRKLPFRKIDCRLWKAVKIKMGMKRAMPIFAALLLVFGMATPVYGIEKQEKIGESNSDRVGSGQSQAPKVVITDIYHRHIGNPDTLGGCYKLAIEHVHKGSAETGGGCYVKPVYHVHRGSEDTGGGCYGKEIFHEHQGNAIDGGGCFSVPVNHEHQDSCYEERECMISYTTVNVLGTETGRCFSGHGETAFVRAEGIATHDSCDAGTENTIIKYCQQCGFMAPIMHHYQAVICGKNESTVEGYKTGCGKGDTDVERYEINCGHREDEIESYEIECDKDVDGYALDCGLKEDIPCGHLIVTNETQGMADQVTLHVKLEDLTGGKLELDSEPYLWWDEKGDQIGSGNQIQVKENGDYSVSVRLKNKDVDESGLTSKILVDNISKAAANPTASATPSPSQSPEVSEKPGSSPHPAVTDTPQAEPETSSAREEEEETPLEENRESTPPIPEIGMKEHKEEDTPAVPAQLSVSVKKAAKKAVEKKAEDKPSPTMTPSPKIEKETRKEVLPKKQAMEKIRYKVGQTERKNSILENPMVRMITATAGVLVLIAGFLLWLFYLRNSVKVCNDDGEGRMISLGRCIVRLEEERYTIKITETMVEKAYTNRYCIKPGLFRLGREGEALVIYKESKNVTIYIDKEMIAVL